MSYSVFILLKKTALHNYINLNQKRNNEICSAIKEANFEVASHGWRWIDYQFIEKKVLVDTCRLVAEHRIIRDSYRTIVFK